MIYQQEEGIRPVLRRLSEENVEDTFQKEKEEVKKILDSLASFRLSPEERNRTLN